MKEIGKQALENLESEPEKTGVVVFARPYNGFVDEAHMGIPHKLASRGVLVFPFDFLPYESESYKRHMYWGMGQMLTKAARFVAKHSQLFGVYITNFSCGPDSFIIGYFREIMKSKPSLTLELDSHTADAGLETRIEAFLDIVHAYRQLEAGRIYPKTREFRPAKTILDKGTLKVLTSNNETIPLTNPRVTLLLPSMGRLSTEALAAVFRFSGINTRAHRPSDEAILKLGRANTSCKECLPLILTTGTVLDYVQNQKKPDEILVYFMATASGPCRFGQYYVFIEDLIKRLQIENVALFSLTVENGYGGLGNDIHLRAWWAVLISDIMEDMRSMILANAKDTDAGLGMFEEQWAQIIEELEHGDYESIEKSLSETVDRFNELALRRDPKMVPTVSLVGEIFVRRDQLSRQRLTEKLAEKGIAVVCAPISEWMAYGDHLVHKGKEGSMMSLGEKLRFKLKKMYMNKYEKRIKNVFSKSWNPHVRLLDIEEVIHHGDAYISPELTGEAILTVGSALAEVATHTCGVIAIGPFGCMPNRLSESILNEAMNRENKVALEADNMRMRNILSDVDTLPFLAIESDGSPFPQLIEAKLEAFCLQAARLHERMVEGGKGDG
jgi:predicted nucleotide-binding protein (sugar kinase/HSP70/actin superfamily)